MDIKSITKRISTVGVALSFVALTACGGGGGGGDTATTTTGPTAGTVFVTNAQINAAQAVLDALALDLDGAAVSPFDYNAINVGRANCLVDGSVIDTNAEINCYQAFLETISPVAAPVV